MTYTRILSASLIGAVIGYITNWLAIKMLFRPYEEKRIFGIKIPFTPGLIPKEQKRIAKSVGDAVGNHLLTNDTMLEALKNNGIDKKSKIWINKKILQIKDRSLLIRDGVKSLFGKKAEVFLINVKKKSKEFILSAIKGDKFKEKLQLLIMSYINKELLKNSRFLFESDIYSNIKEKLIRGLISYKDSQEFKDYIKKAIESKINNLESEDKTLENVIPSDLVASLKVYVYNKNYDITTVIKDILKKDETETKLKKAISEMISGNVNPMLAMFLNVDSIYKKISVALEKKLDEENTQKEIAFLINDIIDKILKNRVGDIFYSIPEDIKNKNLENISSMISCNLVDEESINNIILNLENKIHNNDTIESMLINVDENFEENLNVFIKNRLDFIINSNEAEKLIQRYVDIGIDNVMNINLSNILKKHEDKISVISCEIADKLFNKFLSTKAKDFIEAFDISKIVEDKINSFEVSFAEKIILEIARKELNAITWFGALLGFIMGFVSSLLAAV